MAFSNTIQLTTFCDISATPAETSIFRLSSTNSTWKSTLPLEPSTFLWQVSSPSTGSWIDASSWLSTSNILLTSVDFDNSNVRLLENRRNSTISLTSVVSYQRRLTLQPLPSANNIELWLDATKGIYNGLGALSADDSPVALWGDLSRKERNPTQTIVNNLPILKTNVQNGNNVLRFNGTSSVLIMQNTANTNTYNFLHDGTKYSVFVVVKAGNNSNPQKFYGFFGNKGIEDRVGAAFFYDDRGGANNSYTIIVGNRPGISSGDEINSPVYSLSSNVFLPNQYNVFVAEIDPANSIPSQRSTVYINLTSGPLNNNTSNTAVNLSNSIRNLEIGNIAGSIGWLLGDLCEIIIYRGILQTSERQTVENYLKTKWGTP